MKLTWGQRLRGEIPDPPPPPKQERTVIGSFNGMTLDDWRGSDPHIRFARKLFQETMFRDLLAVLSNSRPKPITTGVTETQALILLGVTQGYDLMLGTLLGMAEFPQRPGEEVPITYGAENFNINTAT